MEKGGWADFTAEPDKAGELYETIQKAGTERMTVSSDSNGSIPVWNDKQEIVDVKVGGMDCLSDAVASMEANQLYFSCGGHYMMPAMASVILYDTLNGITYDGVANAQLNLLNVTTENVAKFREKYLDNPEPIDWSQYSKVYNPDVSYSFETMLSMD